VSRGRCGGRRVVFLLSMAATLAFVLAVGTGGGKATLPPAGGTVTNYSAVVNYAQTYYHNYNPAFGSYPDDCTNFVSQALHAGGWEYTWSDTGLKQATDDKQWWYYANDPYPPYWDNSNSWSAVKDFYEFTITSGRGTYITSNKQSWNVSWQYIVPGDIILVDWDGNGTMDHAMIVVSTSGKSWGSVTKDDVLITQHTTDRIGWPISNDVSTHTNASWWVMQPY
jgi:Putative amidase domain